MNISRLSSETLHASTVVLAGRAVLIAGRSGAGKSDLALRLIDRGFTLLSDDQTIVRRDGNALIASAPPNIAGKLEVRGIGIIDVETVGEAPLALIVDLTKEVERMPEDGRERSILGVAVPLISVDATTASAAAKVRLALERKGLSF